MSVNGIMVLTGRMMVFDVMKKVLSPRYTWVRVLIINLAYSQSKNLFGSNYCVHIPLPKKKHADDNEVVGTLPTEIWLLSDLREISFGKLFVSYLLKYSFFPPKFS